MPRLRTLALLLLASAAPGCTASYLVGEDDAPTAAEPAEAEPAVSELALIPIPSRVEIAAADTFWATPSTPVVVPEGDAEATRVAAELRRLFGREVVGVPSVGPGSGAVRLVREPGHGAEGYRLRVTRGAVEIAATSGAGLFYGAQTLRQMLPARVEHEAAFPARLPLVGVDIEDRPRYPWRGLMLDVARHFFSAEEVERVVDLAALYKLNRLHLHLADDQGWRVEIPGWPRLTSVGAATEVGGGPGGFYTAADYARIVAYAAERHVTVVPEVDLPGHTQAALAAYPELGCDPRTDGPPTLSADGVPGGAPVPYTGVRVGFSALCVEREATWRFVDDVVAALAAATPGEWVHLGGDEVERLSGAAYAAFVARAQRVVAAHGKRLVGWDEIAEAELAPGAVVQVWRPQRRGGGAAVARAARAGARLVLSPADRVYLDMKPTADAPLGLTWAGLNGVRDAYDWEPDTLVAGAPPAAVLGVEAPLWSETLATLADVEQMLLPRLPGVAELGWSAPARRGWAGYRARLGAHAPRWRALGASYWPSPEVDWADGG